MKTLLVGLDNPHANDPRMALHPKPDDKTGGRIVRLISEVVPGYRSGAYLLDFHRTNLYPTRRAPRGRGTAAQDVDAAWQVCVLADTMGIDEMVLFGRRVTSAFSAVLGDVPDYLCCAVVERHGRPMRFWSVPHPSGRNYWYNDPDNRAQAAKLLAALRARQQIPYKESMIETQEGA